MLLYKMHANKPLYHSPLRLAKHEKYGLYGGSFNPVHSGHKAVVDYALESLELRKVILLVTPHNPFKDISIYAPFAIRFADVKQKITNSHCIVSDFEQIIASQNTYQTLVFFKKRYPTVQFTYIIGSDNLIHLHRWHFFECFAKLVKFAIIMRPTHRFAINSLPAVRFLKQKNIAYKLLLKPFHFISSTQLRGQQYHKSA